MKKWKLMFVVFAISLILPIVAYCADISTQNGTLFLAQKCYVDGGNTVCPDEGSWPPIVGGAWGKLSYNLMGAHFKFNFSGQGLISGQQYTLIYYPDPWPGENLICLGNGTANRIGRLTIKGEMDTGNIPNKKDANYNPIPPSGATGGKIWLVVSDDVACRTIGTHMISWWPAEWLFEMNLINYIKIESIPTD